MLHKHYITYFIQRVIVTFVNFLRSLIYLFLALYKIRRIVIWVKRENNEIRLDQFYLSFVKICTHLSSLIPEKDFSFGRNSHRRNPSPSIDISNHPPLQASDATRQMADSASRFAHLPHRPYSSKI